jgi:hypothetical protein
MNTLLIKVKNKVEYIEIREHIRYLKGLKNLRLCNIHWNVKSPNPPYIQTAISAEVWKMFVLSLQKMLYVVSMHVNTTFSSLSYRSVCCSKYPKKHQLLVVSIHLKPLIGFEYSQKSTGLMSDDSASQLTGLASPVHCSPKVWLRYCLTVNRKWGVSHHAWITYVVAKGEVRFRKVKAYH